MSFKGTWARFSKTVKYKRLFVFFTMLFIWSFQSKLLEIVSLRILTLLTVSNSFLSRDIGSKECFCFLKSITISKHLSTLSCSLFLHNQFRAATAALWMMLWFPFSTTSARVVSSTYFHEFTSGTLRSFIIKRKGQGPSLVPWDTPEGTRPHSEKQSFASFTRCLQSIRKSQTHRATPRGICRLEIFWTRIRWSIKSKAFL